MSALDFPLWQAVAPTFRPRAKRIYYDVAVGEGSPKDTATPDAISEGWSRLTRKRIDVVIDAGDAWLLIECRPNAGVGALGSITTYRSLWDRDPPDTRPTESYIVTTRLEPDVHRTAINARIGMMLV
jgi:hypothetical protein